MSDSINQPAKNISFPKPLQATDKAVIEILYIGEATEPNPLFYKLKIEYPHTTYCQTKALSDTLYLYMVETLKDPNNIRPLVTIYDARTLTLEVALEWLHPLFVKLYPRPFPFTVVWLLNSSQQADFEGNQAQLFCASQFYYVDTIRWALLEAKIGYVFNQFKANRGIYAAFKQNVDYQRQFEYTHEAIITIDLNQKITVWNLAATRLFGWTAQEAIGQNIEELLQTKILSNPNYTQTLKEKGYWVGEAQQTAKDGRVLTVHSTVSVIKDRTGKIVELVGIVRDITEQKQAENLVLSRTKDLKDTYELMHGLLHQAPIGIMIFDADGTLVDANAANFRLIGATNPEQMLGRYNIFKDDFMLSKIPAINRAFEGEALIVPLSMDTLAFQSRLGYKPIISEFLIYLFPVYNAENKLSNVVVFMIDETEQRSLRKQLFQAQKLESIGTLAGGIAHDFNNMMTALFMLITALREKAEPDSPLLLELEELNQLGRQATGLTERLLLFTRQKLDVIESFDFNQVILDATGLLRRTIGETISLEIETDNTVGMVQASSSQLSQVLVNLVINARDAIKDIEILQAGEGQKRMFIGIKTFKTFVKKPATRPIHLALEEISFEVAEGWYAACRVEDNGTGIAPENLARIFEPFFTSKEPGRGTGLGLPICYTVIKNHNGWLELDNHPGKGAAFTFYTPLQSDNVTNQLESPTPPPTPLEFAKPRKSFEPQKYTILLVEDEEILRQVTSRMLKKVQYNVITAKNGVEAVALFKQYAETIDLVLTDTVMPEMGGVELIRQLRSISPVLKVILMSGYIEGDDELKHAEKLVNAADIKFLAKPFKIELLHQTIAKCLQVE